jgi:ATP-dependent Clp protease ATP-binding subunit ClpB
MTSNLGAEYPGGWARIRTRARREVMGVVRAHFRPEFLNRIDEIILFHRLRRVEMGRIVDIQLKRLEKLLADRKIDARARRDARNWLADKGYDPAYGARPLKRVIQKELQDPLARLLLEGRIHDGETIRIGVEGDQLSINGVPNDFAKGAAALN